MPALQVKDFPDDLYAELKACASAEDRSLSQQTVHILREYLRVYRELGGRAEWAVVAVERPRPRIEHVSRRVAAEAEREMRIERKRKVFERIDARPHSKTPDSFPSPAEIVRQMRDAPCALCRASRDAASCTGVFRGRMFHVKHLFAFRKSAGRRGYVPRLQPLLICPARPARSRSLPALPRFAPPAPPPVSPPAFRLPCAERRALKRTLRWERLPSFL